MLAIKHILFPFDFSSRCCAAAPFVEAIASRFGAKVTLLAVAQPVWNAGMGDPAGAVYIDPEELRNQLQSRLDSILVKEFGGLPVQRIAEVGDPADVILEFASGHSEKSGGVDLIMMPSHGYGRFRSLLLGSVTAKVLHDAECPVWTGAHMEDPPVQAHKACRAILCAVDNTPKCVPLIEWAAQYAKYHSATLRVVHVIPGIEGWPDRQMDREFEASLSKSALEAIEGFERTAGVQAPVCIAVGEVGAAVRDEARRHSADMVIIGRGLLHETLGRLRTHSYNIIRQAPCPVVSV